MNSEQQQKEYLNQLRTEAQTQMMQDLMNKITGNRQLIFHL